MEDMNARVIEDEEIVETEVEEASDSYNAGALVAGIVGGFLAYAVIGGAKKLRTFVENKLAAKKAAGVNKNFVSAEVVEVEDEEMESGDETPEEE